MQHLGCGEEETLEHHHTGAVLLASDLVPLTVQLLGSASSIVQFPYPHPQFIIFSNVNDIYYQMQIKIIHALNWQIKWPVILENGSNCVLFVRLNSSTA